MFEKFVANGDLVFWIRFRVRIFRVTVEFSNQNIYFVLMLDHEETSENET